jgi:hypothetical protein
MAEQHSINALLSMQKALRSRLSQLNELKNQSTSRTTSWRGEDKTVQEPLYDVKLIDKKIVKINNALFKIDHKIKESNAKTMMEVNIDFDDLTSEIA